MSGPSTEDPNPAPRKGHVCPARPCSVRLPYSLFACSHHWYKLSPATREAIYATRSRHILDADRRAAIEAARREWSDAGQP